MTKNEMINLLYSMKTDLQFLKRDLQFRRDGNNVEHVIEKYKDDDHKFAYQSGAFQAMAEMDNSTFDRAVKTINSIQVKMEQV